MKHDECVASGPGSDEGGHRRAEPDKSRFADAELLAGYHRYRRTIEGSGPRLTSLAHGQSPHTLWIGCSDSRVIPEAITDADPGDLFVLRNIANIVPPNGTDDTVGAVIEYAVRHLHVENIIVCGHSGCGGVAALAGQIDSSSEPHLARWIELARPAVERVAAVPTPDADLAVATVKANVLLQREHLLTYPCVEAARDAGSLRVYAALYTLHSGEVLVYSDARQDWVGLEAVPDHQTQMGHPRQHG
jgi:carbonic anhydrase